MKIPEFVEICFDVGIDWEKIKEISWRCGGSYIYIPKFPEKVEKYRQIIENFENEKKLLGEEKAFCYISKRKNISKKTIKRLLARKEEFFFN